MAVREAIARVLRGVLPLVLLALLVAVFVRFGPVGVFQAAFPPVEELTIQRVVFPADGTLSVNVVNGGPEPVTIAQVTVDEAFWEFTVRPDPVVPRLGSATIDQTGDVVAVEIAVPSVNQQAGPLG